MLSLCMIVKDEEQFLAKCLESVKDFVNEIVIVDTGSTDNTKEIAKEYTDKIYDYKWDNSFSNARNYSIEKSTGDWILVMDADELLPAGSKQAILKLIEENKNPYACKILSYNDLDCVETTHYHTRLFKRNNYYVGRIHEQLYCNNELTKAINITDFVIEHYGYTKEQYNKKDKLNRNLILLNIELSENYKNPFIHYNLQMTYFLMKEYEKSVLCFDNVKKFIKKKANYVASAYSVAANTYLILGKLKQARDTACVGLSLYNESSDLNYIAGYIYYKYKNHIKALEHCTKAINSNNNSLMSDPGSSGWKAIRLLGYIYLNMYMYNEALKCFKTSININASDAESYLGIARVYKELKKSEAKEYYIKVLVMSDSLCIENKDELIDFFELIEDYELATILKDKYT